MQGSEDSGGFRALQRFAHAFIYALRPESSLVMFFGVSIAWLSSASLLGLPVVAILAIGLVQFFLLNLQHSALGGMRPPAIEAQQFLQPGATPFKLLLVVGAWASIAVLAGDFLPLAGTVLAIAGFLLLPALAALLVLENSLPYALHPARLSRIVARGGISYAMLATVAGFLLHSAFETAADSMRDRENATWLVFNTPDVGLLGWLLAGFYLAIVLAHMLGTIVHSAHDFEPQQGHQVGAAEEHDPDSPAVLAASLGDLLRKGDRNAALDIWGDHEDADHVFQAALLDALIHERVFALVPRQAQLAITKKLAAGRPMEALDIAMPVIRDYESFKTVNAGEWLELCRAAHDSGRTEWLDALARQAYERFANDPALLDIVLLHAPCLAASAGDAAALAAMKPFLAWKQHPQHPRLQRLHTALQNMTGAKG